MKKLLFFSLFIGLFLVLSAQCGPGTNWVENGTSGVDNYVQSANIGVDIISPANPVLDCTQDLSVDFTGETAISHSDPVDVSSYFAGIGTVDGSLDVMDTEITTMRLTGFVPTVGQFTVIAGGGLGEGPNGALLQPSFGAISQQSGNPLLADAIFDCYFEIAIDNGSTIQYYYNHTPARLITVVDRVLFPENTTFVLNPSPDCIALYNDPVAEVFHAANLISTSNVVSQASNPGEGSGSNYGDVTRPINLDISNIVIDGSVVNPNVQIDPCDVSLDVSVQTHDTPQNPVVDPSNVAISYVFTIMGDFSTCPSICFTLYNLDSLGNYPDEVDWWNGSSWLKVTTPDWTVLNQVTFCLPLTNSKDGDVEIILNKGGDSPLPVVLSSFTAIQTNSSFAQISWTVATETNLIGYIIYRSENSSLNNAKIVSDLIAATNSTESQNYQFLDENVEMNSTYYYWLQIKEMDNQSEFFGPVSITLEDQSAPDINKITYLSQNYPNPFNPVTYFAIEIKEGETGTLTITNVKGQIVETRNYTSGNYPKELWDASQYGSGIYFYKLQTQSYSEIRKMIMIK